MKSNFSSGSGMNVIEEEKGFEPGSTEDEATLE